MPDNDKPKSTVPIRAEDHPELGPMTEREFIAFNTCILVAEAIFDRTGQVHAGLLHFDHPTNLADCKAVDLRGVPKDEAAKVLTILAQRAPCALIGEAWQSTIQKKQQPALHAAITAGEPAVLTAARHDPNRKEVIAVRLNSGDRMLIAQAEISQDGPEGPRRRGPWTFKDSKTTDLRFVSFGEDSERGRLE